MPMFKPPIETLSFLVLFAAACGGAQEGPRGRAFCESYQKNYINACRQHCEADVELGDAAGVEACKKKCAADLKDDDTYADSCLE